MVTLASSRGKSWPASILAGAASAAAGAAAAAVVTVVVTVVVTPSAVVVVVVVVVVVAVGMISEICRAVATTRQFWPAAGGRSRTWRDSEL